ncbi:MAG: GAF domain-containing sensor histidine kinase [Leucothrix sp.]
MNQRKGDVIINGQQRSSSQQEAYIAEKKYHLSVLYDVADCINSSTSLDDLLHRFLLTMQGLVDAKAAAVRLLVDGDLTLVSSLGLPTDDNARIWQLAEDNCQCLRSFHENCVTRESVMSHCRLSRGTVCAQLIDCEMLAIPLRYQGKSIGIYNLFISRNETRESSITDEDAVLQSIGKHLGMAIEQAGVEDNARQLSIIQERTRMAHELHDSLAQTLASLRYKIRLFDDSLKEHAAETLREELKGLENGIETANAELRSLITHFRAPIDGKGVVRTIESVVERFRRETGFDVFFYHNWDLKDLARDAEIEVVRIVQEGLTNIRKHSGSETVRILLYSSVDGDCSILIEDDGPGLSEDRPKPNKATGEHIGLSVMQERAARLNGELQFESDGEGLLLQLNFKVAVPHASQPQRAAINNGSGQQS